MEEKMKIKEINVGIKKSVKFQTYECGMVVTLDENECSIEVIQKIQKQCRTHVLDAIEKDKL